MEGQREELGTRVMPDDPQWVANFEEEAAAIERRLGTLLSGSIVHIGSTAIPTMIAKPQIDMMAPVLDLADAKTIGSELRPLGYTERPHRLDAVLLVRGARDQNGLDSPATHSLHLTTLDGDLWKERLLSRDALRREARLRAQYTELKQAMLTSDRPYSSGSKRGFVREVLAASGHTLQDNLKLN